MRGITVLFNENYYKVVSSIELDRLLMSGRVKAFRRSTGWVIVGKDLVRGEGGKYTGRERRKQGGRRCNRRSCLACENLVDGKCHITVLPDTFEVS